MSSNNPSSHILKVGGIQAANVSATYDLIESLKNQGSLSVVLSAPNTDSFRTTNVLIESATCLANKDAKGAKDRLKAVEDFVLNTVCVGIASHPKFPDIQKDIIALFADYYEKIGLYLRPRTGSAPLYTVGPSHENDHVASLWKRGRSSGHRSPARLHTVIPFMELGENISAIIYSHLTNGQKIQSRDWIGQTQNQVRDRICGGDQPLIISGALRLDVYERMLARFNRGYSDATAGRLAVIADAGLLVHKEFAICTADPRIVGDKKRPITDASMATIRASLHPLVSAQFLNPHVFANGEPHDIQVGVIGTDQVTRIAQVDIPTALPLIQMGAAGYELDDDLMTAKPNSDMRFIAILDHFPNARSRAEQIGSILTDAQIGVNGDRTVLINVPAEQANDIVRRLHAALCE